MDWDSERSKTYRKAAILSGIPTALPLGVIAGGIMGQWADGALGTDPWLTCFGVLLGMGAGAKVTYDLIKQANREDEQ